MARVDLSVIRELYVLWKPVFPYFARYVKEIFRRTGGLIAEIGPFCGPIFSLKEEKIGDNYVIAAFPKGASQIYRQEAYNLGVYDNDIIIVELDRFSCFKDNIFDLILFRGAFFFPHLFQVDFNAIYNMIKGGGVAIVGGGFGKYTPDTLIRKIGKRSKELNLIAGKIDISLEKLKEGITQEKLKDRIEISTEGGLWTILKK